MKIKAIKGFEDTYAVSDDGRVFNLHSGRELKQKDNKGYFVVSLCSNCKAREYRVHRLVYQAFVGELDNSLVIIIKIICGKYIRGIILIGQKVILMEWVCIY